MADLSYSTIGSGNTNSGTGSNVIGTANSISTANGNCSVIGGGESNSITNLYSTVAGGYLNCTTSSVTTIGGGCRNCVTNSYGTIGGGYCNTASGSSSTISGGYFNATCSSAVVGGGSFNQAHGTFTSVLGGKCNCINSLTTEYTSIGGGLNNVLSCCTAYSAIGGGWANCVIGQSYNGSCYSTVSGGTLNVVNVGSDASSIGGGRANLVGDGSSTGGGSTISGGCSNSVLGVGVTIGGGLGNQSQGGYYSTVGGGIGNIIGAAGSSTISGGYCNRVYRAHTAIPGGSCGQIGSSTTTTFGFGSGSETTAHSNTTADFNLEFKVSCIGDGSFDGAADFGNADYAEYFQSHDGLCHLPGFFTSFFANTDCVSCFSCGSHLLGVSSHTPGVIGDSKELRWSGTFLSDEFGKAIEVETIEQVEETFYTFTKESYNTIKTRGIDDTQIHLIDYRISNSLFKIDSEDFHFVFPDVSVLNSEDYVKTLETVDIVTSSRVKNPEFDPTVNYEGRSKRPEWSTIGLLGKLWVYLDAASDEAPVGSYIKPIDGGKGTLSTDVNDEYRYRVLDSKTFENGTVNPNETSGRLVRIYFK